MPTGDNCSVISRADLDSVQECYQKIVDCKNAWEPLTSQELQEFIFLLSDEYLPRETLWHCSSLAEIVLKLRLQGKLDSVSTLDVLRECLFHMRAFDVLRGLHSTQQEMRERLQSDTYKKRISPYKVFLYQLHMSMHLDQVQSWKIRLRQDLKTLYASRENEPTRRTHWIQWLHNKLDTMTLFQLLLESVDVQLWSADVNAVKRLMLDACSAAHENTDLSAGAERVFRHWSEKELTPWPKFLVAVEEEENRGPQSCLVVPGTGDKDPVFMKRQPGNTAPRLVTTTVSTSSPLYPSYDSNSYKYCVIINFSEFLDSKTYGNRDGSEKDVSDLHQHFSEERGYTTMKMTGWSNELTLDLFFELLESAGMPEKAPKVFVMFLMSHGEPDAIILPSGEKLELLKLLQFLQANPNLQHVPKVIFLQTCLGNVTRDVAPIEVIKDNQLRYILQTQSDVVVKDEETVCNLFRNLPLDMEDFFIVTATLPGHASFRDPTHGSVFIQATLRILKENRLFSHVSLLRDAIQDRLNEVKIPEIQKTENPRRFIRRTYKQITLEMKTLQYRVEI